MCTQAPATLIEAIPEFLGLRVLRRMIKQEAQKTKHCSPVFGRRKAGSGKIRTITDLRQLNSAWVQTPKLKSEHWQTVGECLSLNPQLTWGAALDLFNFFSHLGLHSSVGGWIRIKTEMGDSQ